VPRSIGAIAIILAVLVSIAFLAVGATRLLVPIG
jgi:hypothetical protein